MYCAALSTTATGVLQGSYWHCHYTITARAVAAAARCLLLCCWLRCCCQLAVHALSLLLPRPCCKVSVDALSVPCSRCRCCCKVSVDALAVPCCCGSLLLRLCVVVAQSLPVATRAVAAAAWCQSRRWLGHAAALSLLLRCALLRCGFCCVVRVAARRGLLSAGAAAMQCLLMRCQCTVCAQGVHCGCASAALRCALLRCDWCCALPAALWLLLRSA